VLDRIVLYGLLVVPTKLPDDACTDPDDIKFLECAVAADGACVVSGDRALLRASGYLGIEVVTARHFLEQQMKR
jgi:predicted nucleic acid-binding protein